MRVAEYLSAKKIRNQNAAKPGERFRNAGSKRADTQNFIQPGGGPEVKGGFVRVNPASQAQQDPIVEFQNFAGNFGKPDGVFIFERAFAQNKKKGKQPENYDEKQILFPTRLRSMGGNGIGRRFWHIC